MGSFRRESLLVAAVCLAIGMPARAEEETPRALFQRVVDAIPRVSFVAKMKLTNTRTVREMELSHKQLDDETYGAYISVTDPKDVSGTKFLVIERTKGTDEQYILVPAVARVMRLASNSREQQLLGSEFYVSDLTLPDPESLELKYTGEETIDGRACRWVEATPKEGVKWHYTKVRYAVDPKDLLIVRSEMSDAKGPFKAWTLDKAEKIDDVWTPLVQRMANVRDKVESKLEIVSIKYRVELEDDLFSRSRLERER